MTNDHGRLVPHDRPAAAQLLAPQLEDADRDTLVLGMSRSGLVVADAVGRLLHRPVDALIVQRIAEPGDPHLSLGAVAESGHLMVNRRRVRALELPAGWLHDAATASLDEARRRGAAYRGGRPCRSLAGRRVILVDDAAATGLRLRAAVRAVRALGAREIVVAVPVAPTAVLERLRGRVDRLVCPLRPADVIAQRVQYPTPLDLSDEALRALLARDDADAAPTGEVPRPSPAGHADD